jgi:quercetin dioxygenase-like cupin family protein
MITAAPKFSITQYDTMLNVYHCNKGEGLPKHDHTFSHLTFCHAGSIVVRKEGKELVMTKDTQPVNLVANEWHELEALEDGTVFCNVFAEGKY